MREIVLDTETTGLDPFSGHRLVEIGCVELVDLMPTGNTFHAYINPCRDMPTEAFQVHGLSEEFLSQFPIFEQVVADFLSFIAESPLVIHNAGFDMKFLNYELSLLNHAEIPFARAIDTVKMARQKFPGSPANLDALCRRFKIDNSSRDKHGALLDAELLAAVYLELKGGRQPGLGLGQESSGEQAFATVAPLKRDRRDPRPHAATQEELSAHETLLENLVNPLWKA